MIEDKWDLFDFAFKGNASAERTLYTEEPFAIPQPMVLEKNRSHSISGIYLYYLHLIVGVQLRNANNEMAMAAVGGSYLEYKLSDPKIQPPCYPLNYLSSLMYN